jgi:hypothetical protein
MAAPSHGGICLHEAEGTGVSRSSVQYLLAALVVPAIFIATAYFVGHGEDLYEADPDHAYLLNALNLLNLHRSGMWPHPGATVQIVGGVVIVLTWLLTFWQHGLQSINDAVIRAPEFYLRCIDTVMVAADAAALILLFVRAQKVTRAYFPAIIGCATVLISVPAFLSLHRVNPEPLLLSAAITLAAILMPVVFSDVASNQAKNLSLAMGLALGFSLASKVTSAPLLLFIFLLPGSHRMRALRITAITAIGLTLPVFRNYLDMAKFYSGLLTHKQDYGGGEIGVQNFSQLANNFKTLVLLSPETFAFPAIYGLALAARRFGLGMPAAAARALRICVLIVVLDILLVTKQPQARYLISTIGPLCLGNVIVSYYVLAMARNAKNRAGAAVAVIFVALGISTGVNMASADAAEQLNNRKLVARAEQEDCLLTYYYQVKAVPFMLFFANVWSGETFATELDRAYPTAVFFNNGTGHFENFKGAIPTRTLAALAAPSKCVHLIGSPLDRFDAGHFGIPDRYLTTIVRTPGPRTKALSLLRLSPAFFREAGTP